MNTNFLLLLQPLLLILASAAVTGTVVLDIDNQKLQTGTDYYVLPVMRGVGGGLAMGLRNRSCPYYIAQDISEVSKGLPLQFIPVDRTEKFVQESTDMNLVFSAATICAQSTAWRVGEEGTTGRRHVTTGGAIGGPGVETVRNWFKIERHRSGYKLVFCPSVCSVCKVVCGDVGVFVEAEGKRWVGLSDVPLEVVFKKA